MEFKETTMERYLSSRVGMCAEGVRLAHGVPRLRLPRGAAIIYRKAFKESTSNRSERSRTPDQVKRAVESKAPNSDWDRATDVSTEKHACKPCQSDAVLNRIEAR